jgi:phosphate transport system substrate-binding protein
MPAQAPIILTGAGATFPYPVYSKWFESFHKQFPDIEVRYDPVGSESGLQRLYDHTTDFAASDIRIASEEYFAGGKPRYLRFPTVLGAVVPVYNLPETAGDLRFTSDILAGIYLGRIRKWNDPAIRAANRGAALPDRAIAVVHRSDGSGSTFMLTDYLSKVSPEWKAAIGVSALPKWPVGVGAEGNEGVGKAVRETADSIGYVEYIYAIVNRMNYGSVRNRSGRFVSPDLESIAAAAEGAPNRIAEDFQTSITDAPGADAYPIASFSWFIVPSKIEDAARRDSIKRLLTWILGSGQNQAAALGYVAIPKSLLARELRLLETF